MNLSSTQIDLASCEQEPIRIPGSIQPHGFLLAIGADGHVLQVSDNLQSFLGVAPQAACGVALPDLIGADAAAIILPELGGLQSQPHFVASVRLPGGASCDVIAHQLNDLRIIEFEAVERTRNADFRHLHPLLGQFLIQLSDVDTVNKMSQVAADEMRSVTGFDRVLVYRFDEDGHGVVIAQSSNDKLPSYLHHRFPASDIPRQARELYAANKIRLIPDAGYAPAFLVPALNPLTKQPTDLSFAALRSVSSIHLQYMKNMGTFASMSVSLMVKGQLWGLISCHHSQPKHVSFDNRIACEQLGQILSLRIESREMAEELQFRLDVRKTMVSVLAGLTHGADFVENVKSVFPELLQFARADGVGIVLNGEMTFAGVVPDVEQVRDLLVWLEGHAHDDIYVTDRLPSFYPPAARFQELASGVMAIPISRIHRHYLLWFRSELIQTIEWAGKPNKSQVTGSGDRLTPRTSFESWRETVRGRSLPWHPGEIEMASEFRTALLGIALERAEQMAELAEELGRTNKELEAFSYSVSHDLRAPLRHIVGFSDLLLETNGTESLDKRNRFLRNIKDSATLAGKLVDDLLSFSQMGRAALKPTKVDMNQMVKGCLSKFAVETLGRDIAWQVGDLPVINADPTFIELALYNLLSNAVKFTRTMDHAVIALSARSEPDQTVFSISDNGVGFNMEYVHKLFGVFQRLHRMEDFSGTGIGLANVRRIIERHGGTVSAFSDEGGATFTFSIPHVIPDF